MRKRVLFTRHVVATLAAMGRHTNGLRGEGFCTRVGRERHSAIHSSKKPSECCTVVVSLAKYTVAAHLHWAAFGKLQPSPMCPWTRSLKHGMVAPLLVNFKCGFIPIGLFSGLLHAVAYLLQQAHKREINRFHREVHAVGIIPASWAGAWWH